MESAQCTRFVMSAKRAKPSEPETCAENAVDDQGDDLSERKHFLQVCHSFVRYESDASCDLAKLRSWFVGMDPHDAALWPVDADTFIAGVDQRIQMNGQFLSALPTPDVCGADLGPDAGRLVSQPPCNSRTDLGNASKVRSVLRQFVRDWAAEGHEERLASYGPMLDALLRRMPPWSRGKQAAVLCPGCGLARLPFELAWYGYYAQGNEFSYHMLLGSHFIFNRCREAESSVIFPYVLSLGGRSGKCDHLKAVKIPDVCPQEALVGREGRISMAAGEFVEVYGKDHHAASWDAVLTPFFIDTAKNIFLYVRVLARIVRLGGVWINQGPLLWHYADMRKEISVELSWEELRPAVCEYFDITEEDRREAWYTATPAGMKTTKYQCVFFVAVRNGKPASGTSNPVY